MIFKKQSDSIWASVSDLMTGLMVVFLFVCIGFLYQLKETVNKYEQVRNMIHQDLLKEFKPEDMARLGARIEEDLRVVFIAPTVFFDVGDNTVKPEFQNILAEFFPRYVKVLEKYNNEIVEVRIEGNASLEYNGDTGSNDAYFYNMKLSQERAFNVLQYVFSLNSMQNKRDWMIDKLRANGASYSRAKTKTAEASRCVEISIHRNAEKALGEIKSDSEKALEEIDADVKKEAKKINAPK